jgi:hypothetical protein
MALVPPPNAAGIMAPANPQDPPTPFDITNSKEYVARLYYSKRTNMSVNPAVETDELQYLEYRVLQQTTR